MQIVRRGIGRLAVKLFPLGEFFGIHVVPDHFYYPIPSTRDLDDSIFEKRSECVGLDWNVATQRFYLKEVFSRFAGEREFKKNRGLSLVDAAILHAMVRYHKPRRLIEIGSGDSTRIVAEACLLNEKEGAPCEFIAIDAYPGAAMEAGFPGLSRLVKRKVQAVSLREFEGCDLLFVDSSHVVMIGGDVNFLLLEVVPRAKPGCVIHFHDILLPGEYWKEWVRERRLFWSEQYLLWAFLLFNPMFEVIWASRYMHLEDGQAIQAVFPYFETDRHHITSFWIARR